eukprot:SAG11_NODE_9147_length_938_cov_1.308701_1_plen_196_part_00
MVSLLFFPCSYDRNLHARVSKLLRNVIVHNCRSITQQLAQDEHTITVDTCKQHLEREVPLSSGRAPLQNVSDIVQEVSSGVDHGVSVKGVVSAVMRYQGIIVPNRAEVRQLAWKQAHVVECRCVVDFEIWVYLIATFLLYRLVLSQIDVCVERLVTKSEQILAGTAHNAYPEETVRHHGADIGAASMDVSHRSLE